MKNTEELIRSSLWGQSLTEEQLAKALAGTIERSYAAIESFARAANAMALAENAPVNLTLVKKVLDA